MRAVERCLRNSRWRKMVCVRRLLSKVLPRKPERNPRRSVAYLLLGCSLVAYATFAALMDTLLTLTLFALGLTSITRAALYTLPERRRRAALVLRIADVLITLTAVSLAIAVFVVITVPRELLD